MLVFNPDQLVILRFIEANKKDYVKGIRTSNHQTMLVIHIFLPFPGSSTHNRTHAQQLFHNHRSETIGPRSHAPCRQPSTIGQERGYDRIGCDYWSLSMKGRVLL
jgi:hypothetical protein